MNKFECTFSVLNKKFRTKVLANSKWEAWEKVMDAVVKSISNVEIKEVAPVEVKDKEGFIDFFNSIINKK